MHIFRATFSKLQNTRRIVREHGIAALVAASVIKGLWRNRAVHRNEFEDTSKSLGICIVVEPSYSYDRRHLAEQAMVGPSVARLLEDVVLIGPNAVPVLSDGRIVLEPISPRRNSFLHWKVVRRTLQEMRTLPALLTMASLRWSSRLGRRISWATLGDPTALLVARQPRGEGGAQYGHWMLEHLPQIRAVRAAEKKLGLRFKILVNSNPAPWQLESLEMLGRRPDEILALPSNVLRVHDLLIPTLRNAHSKGSEIDPKALQWVRSELKRTTHSKPGSVPRSSFPNRVFFARENMDTRRLANFGEVLQLCNDYGFVLFPSETMTFAEEGKYLSGVEHAIAVFGSAEAKLLQMPRCQAILELATPAYADLTMFSDLAEALDVEHRRLYVQPSNYTARKSDKEDTNWTVDVHRLEGEIRLIIGSRGQN